MAVRAAVASLGHGDRFPPPLWCGMRRHQPTGLSGWIFLLLSVPTLSDAAVAKHTDTSPRSSATTPSQRLGTFQSWKAYSYEEKSGKVCYLAGEPEKSEPTIRMRKRPLAMVTHRQGEKIANVVSFVEGYPLREGSDVSLDISGTRFGLFTRGDSAWARTAELDKTIVETMVKGRHAIVKGIPRKGPSTTDTYSLSGFPQALALIDKACDVKR